MEEGNSKDSNNLLLLGLELLKNLNKSSKTKLPYAVVKPRVQTPSEEPNTVESLENNIAMSRKRKRSDETTEMDRKEKRRMMNRVAAQNARDRKKQHMETIEAKLALLEQQNRALAMENQQLKQRTSILEAEKESLRSKLDTTTSTSSETLVVNGSILDEEVTLECSHGSAVSTVSLPQKHTSVETLVGMYLSMSFISWIFCMEKWQTQPELTLQDALNSFCMFQLTLHDHPHKESPRTRSLDWWGTHNPGWNPPHASQMSLK